MKHTILKIVAIVLCLSFLFALPAAANEISTADATAIQPEDHTVSADELRAVNSNTLLFSMEAIAVYDFLSSGTGKSFYLSTLPSGTQYIGCWGMLDHSLASQSSNYRMYAGYCYYDDYSATYKRVIRWEFRDGDPVALTETKTAISSLNMNSYTRYYGFIKNDHPSGSTYVSGYVNFYALDS